MPKNQYRLPTPHIQHLKPQVKQIAQAMDKTAQAITEAAHNKVVERVKNGEEIVYKQPATIEKKNKMSVMG